MEKAKLKIDKSDILNKHFTLQLDNKVPVVATHAIQFMKEDDFRAHESKSCIC